jgi:hypothetical protein
MTFTNTFTLIRCNMSECQSHMWVNLTRKWYFNEFEMRKIAIKCLDKRYYDSILTRPIFGWNGWKIDILPKITKIGHFLLIKKVYLSIVFYVN